MELTESAIQKIDKLFELFEANYAGLTRGVDVGARNAAANSAWAQRKQTAGPAYSSLTKAVNRNNIKQKIQGFNQVRAKAKMQAGG